MGLTASDIKKSVTENILTKIRLHTEINVKKTVAGFSIETGYTNKFFNSIFDDLLTAEIIDIGKDGYAKFTASYKKRQAVKTPSVLSEEEDKILK